VPALRRASAAQDVELRKRAVVALGAIGPAAAEAVPDLIAALHDANLWVRRWSVRALGKIGPASAPAVPDLIGAYEDEDADPDALALTFERIGPAASAAIPVLVRMLRRREGFLGGAFALSAIEAMGPQATTALPAMIEVIEDDDSDPLLRGTAANTLGAMGAAARPAIPALEAAAKKGLKEAQRALVRIRGP
jgi:HEAT repeat protein